MFQIELRLPAGSGLGGSAEGGSGPDGGAEGGSGPDGGAEVHCTIYKIKQYTSEGELISCSWYQARAGPELCVSRALSSDRLLP